MIYSTYGIGVASGMRLAAFAASQREDWQTAVKNVEYCDKLKFWLKDKLLLIKNTKN
jgi:hypothetical protein